MAKHVIIFTADHNFGKCQTTYLLLLGYLFRTVSEELNSLCSSKLSAYAALAKAWHKHMDEGQSRTRIYRKAVNECSADDLARPLHAVSTLHLLISLDQRAT